MGKHNKDAFTCPTSPFASFLDHEAEDGGISRQMTELIISVTRLFLGPNAFLSMQAPCHKLVFIRPRHGGTGLCVCHRHVRVCLCGGPAQQPRLTGSHAHT